MVAVLVKGFIYIASAFHTVNRSKCGQGGQWVDNDPHFWNEPPTWGICRNDLRRLCRNGDYIFFVLPRRGRHPQMIFGYIRVEEKISHLAAYHRADLRQKRMGNKNPNGNIIVDAKGRYNRFDAGVHQPQFDRLKKEYVLGDPANSRMLDDRGIRTLAPSFLSTLRSIIGIEGARAIDIISRRGRELTDAQVKRLLAWLSTDH
jgi:hypothetical protein